MNISNNLRKLRLEKGLTQDEISKQLNINRATYAHYETGRREPDAQTLNLFADYFNVSLDFLLGRSNTRNSITNVTLTPKEHENIEEVISELKERLLNTKDLKFDGKPATKEDIETILDSVRVGIEMAKIKKHRNE